METFKKIELNKALMKLTMNLIISREHLLPSMLPAPRSQSLTSSNSSFCWRLLRRRFPTSISSKNFCW